MSEDAIRDAGKTAIAGIILAIAVLHGASAFAQTRASANYSISAESMDNGGQLTSTATYSMNGSVGGLSGVSRVAATAETLKAGYAAQLYNLAGLQVTAPATSVNVDQTLQLGAAGVLDDGTLLALAPGTIAWSVQSGPITSIGSGGLATAGVVYQNTAAVVSGSFDGFAGSLGLTVYNLNFYLWQTQYFGAGNPLAAPGVDADGTGQTNVFKYIAGLNPLDPNARFIVATQPAASPGQMAITFSPIAGGRAYIVQYCTDLVLANWETLTGGSVSTNGNSMTVVDPNANQTQKFYRVRITN